MEKMIQITIEEYNILKEDSAFLAALRSCGVDNWDGYCDAIGMLDEHNNNDTKES
jgi:hypothetical protein